MWKSIKKFFKWIADYTGISWIVKKASSGWNWLFSSKASTDPKNTSPKRHSDENVNKSNTVPTVSTPMQNETEESVSKTDTNVELKAVGKLEFEDNYLWLILKKDIKVQDYQGSQNEVGPISNLLIYLKCDKEEYCITGMGNYIYSCDHISVKSIIKKNEDGNYIDDDKILVQNDLKHVKEVLGLENGVTEVKVDSISTQPFKGTALDKHNPIAAQQDEKGTKPSPTVEVPEAQISNPSKVGNGY